MARKAKKMARSTSTGQKTVGVAQAFMDAVNLMRARQPQNAEEICIKILRADPFHIGAMHLRGTIAYQAGNVQAAIQAMQRVIALKPNDAQAHSDLGMMLHTEGENKKAENHLNRALEISPKLAGAHMNLGNVYRSVGQLSAAEKKYRRAIRLNPKLIETYNNLSLVQLQQGRAEDAIASARKGIKARPGYAIMHARLGNALSRLGQYDAAVAAHEKAIELQPNSTTVYMDYANTLAGMGDMEKSIAQYRHVLKFAPNYVRAFGSLARMEKFTSYDADIKIMEELSTTGNFSGTDQLALDFSLGKAFEDIGEYQKAFEHLKKGNARHRKTFGYSKEMTDTLFDDLIKSFDAEQIAKFSDAGISDRAPIFIMGMPRSGTSLTEQILSSHVDVVGAGELSIMNTIAGRIVKDPTKPEFGSSLGELTEQKITELANFYISQLRSYSANSRFVTDKMPGNFLYIGLIKMMLPNAKIIHCHRDKTDNCLSLFKTHFSSGGLHYAYDLEELGHYYRNYEKLMTHWRKVLPGYIYDVEYEAMIKDQRGQTEKLLQWCDLDWSEDCLNFFNTKRAVNTASIAQVRQPIYASSVQLWRKYGSALDPLVEALGGK